MSRGETQRRASRHQSEEVKIINSLEWKSNPQPSRLLSYAYAPAPRWPHKTIALLINLILCFEAVCIYIQIVDTKFDRIRTNNY